MLTQPQVQRYAAQSGLRDMMIAETEIVLSYLLQLFGEKGLFDKLAFKGGTCLRKIFLGSQGRFSTDLDFTGLEDHDPEEMIIEMMVAFDEPYHEIEFSIEEKTYYETDDGLSWGANPTYKHEWNPDADSEIKLQISRRETPTLRTQIHAQCDQSYFTHLPFKPADIRTLSLEEIIAEKLRACYQRNKARDIYDLYIFATRPLNRDLIRGLVIVKLWQSRDSFDPAKLMAKFEDGKAFDWDDLAQLVRKDQKIDPNEITTTCIKNYAFLNKMNDEERALAADQYGREYSLWEKLSKALQDT